MPTVAEDLADDFIGDNLEFEYWLQELQSRVLQQAQAIQKLPKAALNPSVVATRRKAAALNAKTQQYYRTTFDQIYLAGAHSIDPTFTIGPAERKALAGMNTTEYLKLRTAQQNVITDTQRFMEFVRNDTTARRAANDVRTHRITRWNKDLQMQKRGIKAVSFRDGKRYRYGDYSTMMVRTNANRAYNMGAIHAAEKKKIEFLTCSDGPECGWTDHHDPQTANGMVVTLAEAAAYPLAHPSCVRTFREASPKEIKDNQRAPKTKGELGKAVAKNAAKGAVALLLASEASNLAVVGAQQFASSALYGRMVQEVTLRMFQGDQVAMRVQQRLAQFGNSFTQVLGEEARATVLRGQGALEFAVQTREKCFGSVDIPGGSASVDVPITQQIRAFGDGFMQGSHLDQIPGHIKQVLGQAEHDIEEKMGERFQAFYRYAKKAALVEENAANIISIADYEMRQKGIFQFALDRLPGSPEIRAAFTKWGPRIRVNLDNWARAGATFTETGKILYTAINPAGQLRGVLRLYQDGVLGGHISVIPKNILHGLVRAIVEVDERGQLIGNLRLVPKGPLRLLLKFEAVTRDELGKVIEPLNLKDFRVSTLGAIGNIVEKARQFKFVGAEIEYRIFNQSVFQISSSLRIPFAETKTAVEKLMREAALKSGTLEKTFTGTFKFSIDNPSRIKDILAQSKATIFGNIRFSSISSDNPLLQALKRDNLRLLTRAHIAQNKLQDVVTGMRLRGYNVYDIANVLQLRWDQVREMVNAGLWRIHDFAQDLHVLAQEDILPYWERRVSKAMLDVNRAPDITHASRQQAVYEATQGFYDNPNPYQARALNSLADIQPGDSFGQIRSKLKNLVTFMKMNEADDPTIKFEIDGITPDRISKYARAVSNRPNLHSVGIRKGSLEDFYSVQQKSSSWWDAVTSYTKGKFREEGGGFAPLDEHGLYAPAQRLYNEAEHKVPWQDWASWSPDHTELHVGPWSVTSRDFQNFPGAKQLLDLRHAHPSLFEEYFREMDFLAQRFPGVSIPKATIIAGDSPAYSPSLRQMLLMGPDPSDMLNDRFWSDYHNMIDEMQSFRKEAGEITGSVQDASRVWLHEYSHHVTNEIINRDPWAISKLINNIRSEFGLPNLQAHIVTDWNNDALGGLTGHALGVKANSALINALRDQLGDYSLEDMGELIAEAERHYLTEANPGQLAVLVGRWMDGTLGIAGPG